ncbi:hypothetical protein QT969_10480 [Rhodococcus sp. CSLK01-03]|uniref:Scaffolding protein n=1 Tax=Rhodococcus indonesiensis TaxID=3055869 RepID=A0ABT7RM63_9NOCA|nr:hypothetical protein [Rhodococcus indonesiensis]MDM7488717.1 hypothetical protein [Rhodococcus indonesiensis]
MENEGQQGDQGFTPITSQEQLDNILGARLDRERAKFADYDEIKTKASRFEELEQESKSELQKALERAEAAEKRIGEATRTALHARIAAETGVPVEVIHGDDEESARASAQKVLEWSESKVTQKKKLPTGPLKSGASGSGDQTTGKERAAAALRQLRNGA